jgi:hypothetical protein
MATLLMINDVSITKSLYFYEDNEEGLSRAKKQYDDIANSINEDDDILLSSLSNLSIDRIKDGDTNHKQEFECVYSYEDWRFDRLYALSSDDEESKEVFNSKFKYY